MLFTSYIIGSLTTKNTIYQLCCVLFTIGRMYLKSDILSNSILQHLLGSYIMFKVKTRANFLLEWNSGSLLKRTPKFWHAHGSGHHPHKLPILQQHHNIVINIKLNFECYSRLRLLAHYKQNLIVYLIFEDTQNKLGLIF